MRSTLSRISPPVSSMPIIGTRCTGSPWSLIERMRSRSSSHTVGLVSSTLPCRSRRENDPALPIERHSASVMLNPSHRQLPRIHPHGQTPPIDLHPYHSPRTCHHSLPHWLRFLLGRPGAFVELHQVAEVGKFQELTSGEAVDTAHRLGVDNVDEFSKDCSVCLGLDSDRTLVQIIG